MGKFFPGALLLAIFLFPFGVISNPVCPACSVCTGYPETFIFCLNPDGRDFQDDRDKSFYYPEYPFILGIRIQTILSRFGAAKTKV